MNITIQYRSEDGSDSQVVITADKDKLVTRSQYFEIKLTDPHWQNTDDIIIVLPEFSHILTNQIVLSFFDILLTDPSVLECVIPNEQVQIIKKATLLTKNISQVYTLLGITDFFLSTFVTNTIMRRINRYATLIQKLSAFYLEIPDKFSVNTPPLQKTHFIMAIPVEPLNSFINDFLTNVYEIYLAYTMTSNLPLFRDVCKSIQNIIQTVLDVPQSPNHYLPFLNGSCVIPMTDFYTMCNIFNMNKYIIKIYDYYEYLQYDTQDIPLCKYSTKNYTYPLQSQTIVPRQTFNNVFQGPLFRDFVWTNIIVSGGFVYGVLDNLAQSLISSTDIDLFVYGSDSEITTAVTRMVHYFENMYTNTTFLKRGSVITIIIPDIQYDFQIIPCFGKVTPEAAISNFDLNYISVYYDGTEVYGTIDALFALQYKIAIYYNDLKAIRIYKTYLKGLNFQANWSSSIIDIDDLSSICSPGLNKTTMVRKFIPHCNSSTDIVHLIKLYYKSSYVTCSAADIMTYKSLKNNEYPFITTPLLSTIGDYRLDESGKITYYRRFYGNTPANHHITLNFSEYMPYKIWINDQYRGADDLRKYDSSRKYLIYIEINSHVAEQLKELENICSAILNQQNLVTIKTSSRVPNFSEKKTLAVHIPRKKNDVSLFTCSGHRPIRVSVACIFWVSTDTLKRSNSRRPHPLINVKFVLTNYDLQSSKDIESCPKN